jgi:hypothetical protein
MVNLQKVNWPKSQLAKKVNWLKTPNIAFWLFYAQVDFLASFFGQLEVNRTLDGSTYPG